MKDHEHRRNGPMTPAFFLLLESLLTIAFCTCKTNATSTQIKMELYTGLIIGVIIGPSVHKVVSFLAPYLVRIVDDVAARSCPTRKPAASAQPRRIPSVQETFQTAAPADDAMGLIRHRNRPTIDSTAARALMSLRASIAPSVNASEAVDAITEAADAIAEAADAIAEAADAVPTSHLEGPLKGSE